MALQELLAVVPEDSDERALLRAIDFTRLPRHIAIIMDGNGRWAKLRRKRRVEGHRAGIASVRDTVETSARLGLEVLTLYAFSVENWKRPKAEVATLMPTPSVRPERKPSEGEAGVERAQGQRVDAKPGAAAQAKPGGAGPARPGADHARQAGPAKPKPKPIPFGQPGGVGGPPSGRGGRGGRGPGGGRR